MKYSALIVIGILLTACGSTKLSKQNPIIETASNNSDQSKKYMFENTAGGEEPPYVIRKAPLEYPRFARSNRIEGIVILQVEIFADGTIGRVEVNQSVMSGQCMLSEAAVKSVKKWKFSPAKHKGKPVNCWTTIPIGFKLKKYE